MSVRTDGIKTAFPELCPVCNGRRLGKVGIELYFCWDCCAQFTWGSKRPRVWEIADDGTLVPHTAFSSTTEGPGPLEGSLVEAPAAARRVAGGQARD